MLIMSHTAHTPPIRVMGLHGDQSLRCGTAWLHTAMQPAPASCVVSCSMRLVPTAYAAADCCSCCRVLVALPCLAPVTGHTRICATCNHACPLCHDATLKCGQC